jgi:hypothetical protein
VINFRVHGCMYICIDGSKRVIVAAAAALLPPHEERAHQRDQRLLLLLPPLLRHGLGGLVTGRHLPLEPRLAVVMRLRRVGRRRAVQLDHDVRQRRRAARCRGRRWVGERHVPLLLELASGSCDAVGRAPRRCQLLLCLGEAEAALVDLQVDDLGVGAGLLVLASLEPLELPHGVVELLLQGLDAPGHLLLLLPLLLQLLFRHRKLRGRRHGAWRNGGDRAGDDADSVVVGSCRRRSVLYVYSIDEQGKWEHIKIRNYSMISNRSVIESIDLLNITKPIGTVTFFIYGGKYQYELMDH